MGKNAKLKEQQKWSNEKHQLDNARKLQGIYFIGPQDTEFNETIKNARQKLKTSVAPTTPCTIMKNCGSGASNKIKTRQQDLRVFWKLMNPKDCVLGNSLPSLHEDYCRKRKTIHYSITIWYTNLILCLKL